MRIFFYLLFVWVSCFCSYNSVNASEQASKRIFNNQDTIFKLPDIPIIYTSSEQRATYLALHYWDNFNFGDTNYLYRPEITEQAWVDYIDVLNYVTGETAVKSLTGLMKNAEVKQSVYRYFTNLAEKYLYDPNSPFRNEEFYIPVLESIVTSKLVTDTDKIRPKYRLELARKNRLGAKALDFEYTQESGKQGKLSDLLSDYILIYFNNPGCHACEEITRNLRNSLQLQRMQHEKKLVILSVYPDEDLTEWKRHLTDFPNEWIIGYDKPLNLRNKNLYDLKAIPTLYLLDKDKTVILKDATFEQIENYFRIKSKK